MGAHPQPAHLTPPACHAGRKLKARQLAHEATILHQPDQEPTRHLCPHCLTPVLHATISGQPVIADLHEWLPRGQCHSCLQTRRAHPGSHIDCSRCAGTGMVGSPRPHGTLLAIDVAWGDTIHTRLIGPTTDRRRGEALYPLHICQADY